MLLNLKTIHVVINMIVTGEEKKKKKVQSCKSLP